MLNSRSVTCTFPGRHGEFARSAQHLGAGSPTPHCWGRIGLTSSGVIARSAAHLAPDHEHHVKGRIASVEHGGPVVVRVRHDPRAKSAVKIARPARQKRHLCRQRRRIAQQSITEKLHAGATYGVSLRRESPGGIQKALWPALPAAKTHVAQQLQVFVLEDADAEVPR